MDAAQQHVGEASTLALMKQFDTRSEPVRFRIDGDEFEASPDIPAATMFKLANLRNDMSSEDRDKQYDAILSIFRELLTDQSYEVLHRRLASREHPIGLKTMNEVIEWLMGEAYGVRPTQPSPSSPEQSAANPGITSTDGAQPVPSTPSPFPGLDS